MILFSDEAKVYLRSDIRLIFYDKMKIQALHLSNIMEYAQIRGISRNEMVGRMKNLPSDFLEDKSTVEVADFYAVVKGVNESLQDALLGMRLGEFMNLKALGLIYQISLQTTTVEEALSYLKSYLNATFPLISINIEVSEEQATIVLRIENDARNENRVILENTLTVISREVSVMAGKQLSIRLFSPFCHSTYPDSWQKGESFSLTFTNAVLKATLQDKSRWQLDVLVPDLKLIEGLKSEPSFTTNVKMTILSMAKPELPGLEMVADAFNMTARTFQRRLDTENTTFRLINAELKRQISYLLIGHNRFSVADISDVLGFSEPASFIHSFKKWYGDSPEKFRQQLSR